MLLAPTSYRTTESVAPGGGRDGGIVSGGEVPVRYQVTNLGQLSLSAWCEVTLTYSFAQINKGSNPLSNIQVVSALNSFNIAHFMFHYNTQNNPERYYPKVYLGTTQTIALDWLFDRQIYAGSDIKIPENWPINGPQKGEAKI